MVHWNHFKAPKKPHHAPVSSILLSPFRCSGSAWVLLSTINLNIQKGPKLVVLTGKKSKKSMQKHVPSRLAKSHVGGFFEYSKQRHSWEYDGCVGGWFSLSYFPDRWGELTGMIIMTEPWYRTSQIGENCQWKRKKTATKRYNRLRWSIIVLVDNIKQYQAMKPYALKPRSLQGFNKWVHELIRYHTVIPMCSWSLTKTLIWAMGFQQPVVPWDSRLSSQEDGPLDMRNPWDPPEAEVPMEA